MPRTLSPENVLAPKSWPQYHPTHLHGTRLFDAKVGTKLNYHFNLYVFFYFYPIETTSLVLTSEKGLTPLSLSSNLVVLLIDFVAKLVFKIIFYLLDEV